MSVDSDDLKTFSIKCRTMNIEELKSNIDDWERNNINNNCSIHQKNLAIAKNELELKYNERKEQIKLLTKSLTSSTRIGRWIASVKALFK
tara:strand:- start:329 stop:598 length:270 start_codon:yes stop_codon:yes gene_type:complete